MANTDNKNWIDIIQGEFSHPAIVLWRAVELRHIEKALEKYALDSPVLDLGCAEGKIAKAIFKESSLIGLDNCWKLMSKKNAVNIYKAKVIADGCKMPFKSAVFGSIFSNCVIEHIPDLDSVLNESSRVIKDGGIFLFTVPSHKFGDFLFFTIIFEKLGLKTFASWYKSKRNKLLNHFHCFDHNKWKDILKDKGFRLLEYNYYMTKEATFHWDFLAALVLFFRIWPLSYFLPKINKSSNARLSSYYKMDCEIGSSLLLVAQKGA